MKIIVLLICTSLLIVAAMSAQTTKTWNYALWNENARTRQWNGNSWVTSTLYDKIFSDVTVPACAISTASHAIALSEPTEIKRIWVDVRDVDEVNPALCSVIIKASQTSAPTTTIATSGFSIGSRDLPVSGFTAYKYFEVNAVNNNGYPCRICGFEAFTE